MATTGTRLERHCPSDNLLALTVILVLPFALVQRLVIRSRRRTAAHRQPSNELAMESANFECAAVRPLLS